MSPADEEATLIKKSGRRTGRKARKTSRRGSPRTVAAAKRSPAAGRKTFMATQDGTDPLWYKKAIIYELHVRSFKDSTADGIGDFNGLIAKLDYLADLGVTAVWLLPFYPSPLRDDGYDIADYLEVNPSYGTMADVRRFIAEAHRRGLRVVTELVINHTSDAHPWFQRARRAPKGSTSRDFYVWSDSPEKYKGTRIIFKDFERSNWTWDPVAQQYYWHRFYHHQPDLNYDNPAVHDAVFKALDFWMRAGVDGLRLDAIPYLYEREGTSCENLPETHEFLKKLRKHVSERFPGRMLLAEANQWPEDAIAYFGDGDECHMSFHFPLMPRLFMGLRMEDRFPIIDILQQTPHIPETCQWALFLRNHDELTLEMVTDEERDYMYRVYASDQEARINLGIRRRLAPLLNNNRRKIELLNALLFSMPGTPVIYYGDEIGMGDNVYLGDRDGVRTPMQWSADRNAGFSSANPQRLFLPVIIDPEYHYETMNVEAQLANASSLLWWMKRLIALRQRHPVFGLGDIRFLSPDNPKVLAFIRTYADERVMVAANLSRFAQPAELELGEFQGMVPVEMFGQTRFPTIGSGKYCLSLGPHAFYWFSLMKPETGQVAVAPSPRRLEDISIPHAADPLNWLTSEEGWSRFAPHVTAYMPRRRWFMAKTRALRAVDLIDAVPITAARNSRGQSPPVLMLLNCEFNEGEPEVYALPVAAVPLAEGASPTDEEMELTIATVRQKGGPVLALRDVASDPALARTLLEAVVRNRAMRGAHGEVRASRTGRMQENVASVSELPVRGGKAEQSNTTVFFGDRLLMKLFRRVELGVNPDLEVSRHLTEVVKFPSTPPLAGALEYVGARRGERRSLGLIQQFVANQGDAWSYTIDEIDRFFDAASTRIQAIRQELPEGDEKGEAVARVPDSEPAAPELSALEFTGDYPRSAELLGQRTAEMHVALADDRGDSAFAPEAFTLMYQRSLLQSLRNITRKATHALRPALGRLPDAERADAEYLLNHESDVVGRFKSLTQTLLPTLRIRCHGDLHLGQVLWTGRDFVIIDFEGEPLRSIGERLLKRTPLRDVAGMLRSFHYAAFAGLRRVRERGGATADVWPVFERLAGRWSHEVGQIYLSSYLNHIRQLNASLVPADDSALNLLLRFWLTEKAMYEVLYELNSRPDWVGIPLRTVRGLVSEGL